MSIKQTVCSLNITRETGCVILKGMPVGPTKEVFVEVFFIRSSELSVIANSLTSPSHAKATYKPDGCMSKWKGLSVVLSYISNG